MAIRPTGQWHFTTLSADTFSAPDNSIASDAAFKAGCDVDRDKLKLRSLVVHPVLFTALRKGSDLTAPLASSASGSDLGLVAGTFGTDSPLVKSSDGASATVTQKLLFEAPIHPAYEADQNVQIRVSAAMAAVSDTSATVDLEVYKVDREGGISSDLCATAAQSINSTSFADKDFTITDTNLEPGDKLYCRLTVAITDAATASGVLAEIGAIEVLEDRRG